ncbi:alpha/beta fold hydrolase [Streptomyces natalensis]|uniref:Lipase n=1 Tax=Streptomyces natalensis ATCC 27448 TaxID=1240678 RepID=A0A0D7CHE0_9ACTN|nr:alpha/beta fold hydrolase [Streptomyces natalensis]KIZ14817.1 lipase [Streptomyces natalensis ATCC 27448]
MRLRTLPLALVVATCTFLGIAAGPAQADSISPPGANDWTCKPSAAHPHPVVLVHGTFEDMAKNWSVLSPQIKDAGYCVFALNYGNNATAHIPDSAQELNTFVDSVLGATGAKKVDLVGHSQGGMMPRYYLGFLGGATKVDELVGIVPSNHGTTNPLTIPTGYAGCDACTDQMAGSPFLTHLNANGDTVPGPDYTVITTTHDEVVTPYTSAFLDGPAQRVTNVTLQDRCPLDAFEHDQSPNDPVVAQWVLNALGRSGPADPAFTPHCT